MTNITSTNYVDVVLCSKCSKPEHGTISCDSATSYSYSFLYPDDIEKENLKKRVQELEILLSSKSAELEGYKKGVKESLEFTVKELNLWKEIATSKSYNKQILKLLKKLIYWEDPDTYIIIALDENDNIEITDNEWSTISKAKTFIEALKLACEENGKAEEEW